MMARIAIFTPVRNAAPFIDGALRAVQQQTYDDWSHIVLDADSEDGTSALVEKAASADARVQHLRRADAGQYDALLPAMRDTSAQIIGWLNADDFYPPWALKTVAEFFDAHPDVDWIAGLPALWDAEGTLKVTYPRTWYAQSRIAAGWYHDDFLGCLQQESIFFRKRLIDRLTPEDVSQIGSAKLAGDFLLWKKFATFSPLIGVPTILGGFHPHGENRSVTQRTAYEDELDQFGRTSVPAPIAAITRRLYDMVGSYLALRSARRAAHAFQSEPKA